MSWYIEAQSQSAFFADKEDDALTTKQTGSYLTLFDVQRYVMDSYDTKVAMSQTGNKLTVSLMINHNFLGSIAWDAYWSYKLNEFKKAKSTYDKINKSLIKVTEEFIEKEIPTSIYCPTIRRELDQWDLENQAATNIPSINYSRRFPIEPDWRKNIYGTRYPVYTEPNYKGQTKFWAIQRD